MLVYTVHEWIHQTALRLAGRTILWRIEVYVTFRFSTSFVNMGTIWRRVTMRTTSFRMSSSLLPYTVRGITKFRNQVLVEMRCSICQFTIDDISSSPERCDFFHPMEHGSNRRQGTHS